MSAARIAEELFTTFAREGTIESILPLLDNNIEWSDEVVTKTTVRGHDGFVEAMANLEREGYRTEALPEGYDALSERTALAHGVTRLVSGASYTDLPAYWAFEVRDGKIVRGASAIRRADALRAIGH